MNKMALYWIDPESPADDFPPVETALSHPDGLLCFGGDLSPERLLAAYRRGIFPWFSRNQPVMWWSPDPRCVLFPDQFKASRSLKKVIRNGGYEVTIDQAFNMVIESCAAPRQGDPATWITGTMKSAYKQLHALGNAHSVEIWRKQRLVGGLYGISMGKAFFGESMFSREDNTSKLALFHLSRRLHAYGFKVIDCQISSSHLYTLGAQDISRRDFTHMLDEVCDMENPAEVWQHARMPVGAEIS